MTTPNPQWSDADVSGWAQGELQRGKSRQEVAVRLVGAGWSKESADALLVAVERDLNANVTFGPGLLERILGSWTSKAMCWTGSHSGEWKYQRG